MPAKTYVFDIDSVRSGSAGPDAALIMEELFVQWTSPGGAGESQGSRSPDRLTYVLEGEVAWDVDGQEYRLSAGDALYLPAGLAAHQSLTDGRTIDVLGATAWDRVHLAEHQMRREYRNWEQDNPAVSS